MEAVDIDVFKLVASERRCSVPTQRWLKGFEVFRRVVFSKEALEASSQKVVTAHEQFFFFFGLVGNLCIHIGKQSIWHLLRLLMNFDISLRKLCTTSSASRCETHSPSFKAGLTAHREVDERNALVGSPSPRGSFMMVYMRMPGSAE